VEPVTSLLLVTLIVALTVALNTFISRHMLQRCDVLFHSHCSATYINKALNQQSYTDYTLVTCHNNVRDFAVLEPEINFSDHLPVFNAVAFSMASCDSSAAKSRVEFQLRWDKDDCE